MCFVMLCLISTILLIFMILQTNGLSDYGDSNVSVLSQNNYNITNKVNKIAKDILSHSSPNNREFVIRSVENKLFKAAEHLGEKGKKHVQLIMEGIKEKILNFTMQEKNNETKKENDKPSVDRNDSKERTQAVNNLSNTIKNLINAELDNLKTEESKLKLLGNIKRRFLDSINEKLNIVPVIQPTDERPRVITETNGKEEIDNYFANNNKIRRTDFINNNVATSHTLKSFTVADICNNAYQVCSEILDMNSLKCIYNDDLVSLDTLCDGSTDCPHGSDEKYCGSQVLYILGTGPFKHVTYTNNPFKEFHLKCVKIAKIKDFMVKYFVVMERMEFSIKIINKIDNLNEHNCFHVDELTQTRVIRDVLQTQLDFKEQYLNFSSHMNKLAENKETDSEVIINRKANEIALIISSLALALHSTLCSKKSDDIPVAARRSHDKVGLSETVEKITWPPKCSCIRDHCPNCTDTCKRICRHKHGLANWNCESTNGSSVISLNSLCDGRPDCIDESDENGCDTALGYAKFDAHGIYSNILKMLNLKASKERPSTRKKLLYLYNLVTKLQKFTTESDPDKMIITKLRDQCFSLLNIIYTDILEQSAGSSEIEDAYLFLAALNQNLGLALKRSSTGNDREINDSCFCRNGTCSVPFCSKVCYKACAAEPKLTAYQCKDAKERVSLNKICNGKLDCRNGYDEQGCKKGEICRRHHLLILKRALLDMGLNLKGTSLGELINSWKVKAIQMIKIAEKDSRPKPKIFKNIIKDILKSLVVTYGSVDYYRRNSKEYGLPEFQNIAQLLMENMKLCGK